MHTIYIKETASKRRVVRSVHPNEIYMLVFSKKENEQFTTLSFLENDSILKSINVQRIDILIDTLGNGSTESKFDIISPIE